MTRSFHDDQGRYWTVAVNVTAVKRVRDSLGIDLLSAGEGKLFAEIAEDPIKLGAILYELCGSQHQVTPEQFGEGLTGDTIDNATAALIGALIDFFPKGRRNVLAGLAKRIQTIQEAGNRKAMEALDDPAIEQRIQNALSGKLSMSSAA